MKCHVCGSNVSAVKTSLPFKINEKKIVIFKDLPVWQCDGCKEYLLEDLVMQNVDNIIENIDSNQELEVVHYAA